MFDKLPGFDDSAFDDLKNMVPTVRTIHSSKLEWEVFPFADHTAFCADGDGFVSLEQYADHYLILDQGDVVARLPNGFLSDALETAQSYLAATYHGVFKMWELPND